MKSFYLNEDGFKWWKQYEKIIDEFPIPTEGIRENFQSLIFMKPNKNFRRALKRDMTEIFFRDLERACKQNQTQHIELIGDQFSGKSTLAYIISKEVQKRVKKAQIIFVYSYAAALTEIFEGVTSHSIFTVDEPLYLSGPGSRTLENAFANVFQMCRKYMLHFIFNVSEFVKIPNVSIYLELFGYNVKTGVTRCLWRDKRGRYKGIVLFEKNFEDKEYQEQVESKKDAKWDSLTSSQGIDSVKIENSDEIINEIVEAIKKDAVYKSAKSKDEILAFMRKRFGHISHIIAEKDIAPLVKVALRTARERKQREERGNKLKNVNLGDYQLSFMALEDKDDPLFWEEVLERLNYAESPDGKTCTEFEVEVFRAICNKEPYSSISDRFFPDADSNKGGVWRVKDYIQQNFLGYVGEEIWYERKKGEGHDIVWAGKISNDPDFIDHTKRTVISFKTGASMNKSKWQSEIALSEVEAAVELGYDLILRAFVMRLRQFKIWAVSFHEIKNSAYIETPLLSTPAPPPRAPHPTQMAVLPHSEESGGVSGLSAEDITPFVKLDLDKREQEKSSATTPEPGPIPETQDPDPQGQQQKQGRKSSKKRKRRR